ncbi:hypothetical protein [Diaphorobacter sp. ED-3]|uniref:hypothetical protein n=1 Tax=Diaphorobacter sp. ED-3 TaxID=3016636 RepID=UPI0022DD1215|nr:hypothetical protein [Diaphorobacter sp. ED-3]
MNVAAISEQQQARIRRENENATLADLLRWLNDQGVGFIELKNGGGIDVANAGGLIQALIEAREDQRKC